MSFFKSVLFYFTIDQDEILKEGEPLGGDGGTSFDDARDHSLITTGPDRHRCVNVEVHWDRGSDNKLTSICFNYGKIKEKNYYVGRHRGT